VRGETVLRRVAAAAGVLVLAAAGLAFLEAPGRAPPAPRQARPEAVVEPFHRYDRAVLPEGYARGYCTVCHPAADHRRDPRTRAFLNLHPVSMDCGVCHLAGRRLAVRRLGRGRLFAAQRDAAGWRRVDRPGRGVRLRPEGPACRQCHRRGSPLLATPGLYDPYRRRLLEDLAVLRWLGRGP